MGHWGMIDATFTSLAVAGLLQVVVLSIHEYRTRLQLQALMRRITELEESVYEDDDPDPGDGEPMPEEETNIVAFVKVA